MRRQLVITEVENGYLLNATINLNQAESSRFNVAMQMGTAQMEPALGMYVARDVNEAVAATGQLLRGQEPVPAAFREGM